MPANAFSIGGHIRVFWNLPPIVQNAFAPCGHIRVFRICPPVHWNYIGLNIRIFIWECVWVWVYINIYSRENGELNQTFEKQNMQFKRTWVEYHYCKILKNAGLLYFVKMSSMFEICSEFLWEAQSRDSSVHCSISFSALSRLRLP